MGSWGLWALLFVFKFQKNHGNDNMLGLFVPQAVELVQDLELQRLSVTWEQSAFTHSPTAELLFDIEVLQSERTVHQETIKAGPVSKGQQWNWTSPLPLQCTSHSVRIRTRVQNLTSQWSPRKTVDGMDVSTSRGLQVYPSERVLAVGSSVHFCCIVSEGNTLKDFRYNHTNMNSTPISHRSYTMVLGNLAATKSAGNDVECMDSSPRQKGVTIFVGYPPGDRALVCETDLVIITCRWDQGRPTHLLGDRRTLYTLNGRKCSEAEDCEIQSKRRHISVPLDPDEQNFTLTAKNPLGSIMLTYRADLNHTASLELGIAVNGDCLYKLWNGQPCSSIDAILQVFSPEHLILQLEEGCPTMFLVIYRPGVRMQAPSRVTSPEVNARNATLQWRWEVEAYQALRLQCQVQLHQSNHTHKHNYTGTGLYRLVLTKLRPDSSYSLRVRCGTLQHFYKWSKWSSVLRFQTKEDRPDALDVWIQMKSNDSALLMWKPLSSTKSNVQIQGYNVTWARSMGREGSKAIPRTNHSFLLWDLGTGVATVTAFNAAGSSPPSSIGFPRISDGADDVRRISGTNGSFSLVWPARPNTTCGYVVEWSPAHCQPACLPQWLKVQTPRTSTEIPRGKFEPGVKYSLSVYSCSQKRHSLMVRQEGYAKELAPSQSVQSLGAKQIGSGVQLHWDAVPLEGQHGFIRGYYVYKDLSSGQKSTENITNPDARGHTMRDLPPGYSTFTVKAYTSAGEGKGDKVSITVNPSSISFAWSFAPLICLVFLPLITAIICFWKRNWMKEMLYPDIPFPKLLQDWPASPMFGSQTLDLVECPHDRVEVMSYQTWNSGGVLGEEKVGSVCSPETDSGTTLLFRCYQQGVGRASSRSVQQGPAALPLGPGHTEITYSLVQTPAALLWLAPGSGEYQPQASTAPPLTPLADLPFPVQEEYQPLPLLAPPGPTADLPLRVEDEYQPLPLWAPPGPPADLPLRVEDEYQPLPLWAPPGPPADLPLPVEDEYQSLLHWATPGPPADLPLPVEHGYQPLPAHGPNPPRTVSLDESLDTPTSADSFTFLLGRASVRPLEQSPVLANPVEQSPASANPAVHRLHPHQNYTNPTYQPTDPVCI